ncbi:MAG: hypothetical protein OXU45_03725 [Candidatus Melainabacteria bacterium]|nr:hypothetical protein [Candidatus Melainabacteria bacterium]
MIAIALIIAFSFVAHSSIFVLDSVEINSRKLVQTSDWLVGRHENLVDMELEDLVIE